jgi:hypothetical protein
LSRLIMGQAPSRVQVNCIWAVVRLLSWVREQAGFCDLDQNGTRHCLRRKKGVMMDWSRETGCGPKWEKKRNWAA